MGFINLNELNLYCDASVTDLQVVIQIQMLGDGELRLAVVELVVGTVYRCIELRGERHGERHGERRVERRGDVVVSPLVLWFLAVFVVRVLVCRRLLGVLGLV